MYSFFYREGYQPVARQWLLPWMIQRETSHLGKTSKECCDKRGIPRCTKVLLRQEPWCSQNQFQLEFFHSIEKIPEAYSQMDWKHVISNLWYGTNTIKNIGLLYLLLQLICVFTFVSCKKRPPLDGGWFCPSIHASWYIRFGPANKCTLETDLSGVPYLGGLLHQMNQPELNWIKVNHSVHFVHHQIPLTINSAKAAVAASVVPASGSAENNTTAQL